MREILFRGKRIDSGEWVEGIPVKTHIGTFIVLEENPHYCDQYGYMEICELAMVDPTTVGEYTGLTDKNGKKTFEGDIVVAEDYVYACQWNNCNIEFELANEVESFCMCYVYPDVEVIGNIHDNPELLTQKNI